jgi:N-terminal acetyltransferase B complex catalytic subunit
VAIEMYEKFGYQVYRAVNKYYSSSSDSNAEDAYDMRKSLKRDTTGETSKPTGKKI